ncbi:MAG: hypothetical protein QM698_13670 [Micropepsaceae bacterium]
MTGRIWSICWQTPATTIFRAARGVHHDAVDDSGGADAFEDDVGAFAGDGLNLGRERLVRVDGVGGAKSCGGGFAVFGAFRNDDVPGAEETRPQHDGEADRAGADDEDGGPALHFRHVDGVKADAERFDEGAFFR